MNALFQWMSDNKSWLFDGLGVAILGTIVGLLAREKRKSIRITQKGGNKSINVQKNNVGGKND